MRHITRRVNRHELLAASMIILSGHYESAGGLVGRNALDIALAKVGHDFIPAIVLGMLCNALVCLSVWMCMGARSTTSKILVIIFPITAFVAAGFEHSIANMYFIPVALGIKAWAPDDFWAAIERSPADYAGLTWQAFLADNLLPVTIGNVIGGGLMVGLVYWAIFLRPRRTASE